MATVITMRRYIEPLLLGLASLLVYAGGVLVFEASRVFMDGAALSPALVYAPGLALLGFVAGRRESPLGLLAIIACFLAALLAALLMRVMALGG